MDGCTEQMDKWAGDFGKDYTDRNALSVAETDELYTKNYGQTRTEINERSLAGVSRSSRVLEVGANIGTQLQFLQTAGFGDLYGIELQQYAVELAKSQTENINIIRGSAFDIPFKDGWFDLVFTSGVLIHINPSDVAAAMREIHRCTREYIWGLEYYADEYTEVPYRGNENLMWKTDFAKLYLDQFEDLELVREDRLPYLGDDNVDTAFLLRKTSTQS